MRLGNKKEKKCFFILYCSHLVLSLNKIGCGSAIKKRKKVFFHFVLLSPFTIFAEKYCDAEYGNFKY